MACAIEVVADQLLSGGASMQKPSRCDTVLQHELSRFPDANRGVKASKSRQPCLDQPPEKCAAKARAKPPNPPRVVSPEPDWAVEAEDDGLAESPPKKLLRDQPPPPPWPPPEEELRDVQATVPGDDGAAIPGPFGSAVFARHQRIGAAAHRRTCRSAAALHGGSA